MAKDKYYGKTLRKNFARHEEVMAMPNLLEIQKKSYQWFLDTGLREVFADVASIVDYAGNLELSFIDYSMDEKPKYDVEECKARDATYAAPMKVSVRLHNKETGEIKEQEIFMGDFPLMTHSGTFVINGAERVVVSQIVRSPGIYYGKEIDLKTDLPLLTSTVIPYRGAWLEYETDSSEVFWVRIDKTRKLPITCLIRALGLKTDGEILDRFGDDPRIVTTMEKDTCKSYEEAMLEIYRKLRPGEPPTLDSAETLLQNLFFDPRRYDLSTVGRYKFNKKLTLWAQAKGQKLAEPVADPATGELLLEEGHVLSGDDCRTLDAIGVGMVKVRLENGEVIRIFTNRMCDMSRYVDFDPKTACGIKERVRFDVLQELLSQYQGEELIEQCRLQADRLVPKHIIVDDILTSINYMNVLAHGLVQKDDIDHLGNRRLRCVGELLQNQFRIGFSRLDRVIRERMTVQDLDSVTPQSLINIRPVTAVIKEFFGSSQLSQFMDQNNPLGELTHKRRLSALGPGGLSRDRAGFEVRDVHYSHYGRMCPIETPEGPNIGLINSLASYARINEYGLSKENEEAFKKFRNYYNKTKEPIDLYTLSCYSFNYQFRFNNNKEYNNPFGRNRSQFSDNMKSNLILFTEKLKSMNVEFLSEPFDKVDLSRLNSEDFVYCDPPYLITTGSYNDGNRGFKDWKEEEEIQLYKVLDELNKRKVKFALSNVIEHKGKENILLKEWSKKYKTIYLTSDYSNSSYNTKRDKSIEVLIINY